MLSQNEISRYGKQIMLPEMGLAGQEKLKAASVLVIGAGGLGSPVLQYLAATGIGTIGIADADNVDISNLQRQVLYTTADIGQSKAAVAEKKLAALNPEIKINTYPVFIDHTNALEILKQYDVIVDGSDNFATRYLVNDACVMLGKPMVSGAIYKYEGQVSVFNYKGGPTYRCIFPEPPGGNESPNCADIGVIATLPGIIGTIQANEVIKIITGVGEVLSGKLLVMDTLAMNSHIFSFRPVEANRNVIGLPVTQHTCDPEPGKMYYEELKLKLQNNAAIQLVDVREPKEHRAGNIGGINIPVGQLAANHAQLDEKMTTVLYCSTGIRSLHGARVLMGKGFRQVFNLEHGIIRLGLTPPKQPETHP